VKASLLNDNATPDAGGNVPTQSTSEGRLGHCKSAKEEFATAAPSWDWELRLGCSIMAETKSLRLGANYFGLLFERNSVALATVKPTRPFPGTSSPRANQPRLRTYRLRVCSWLEGRYAEIRCMGLIRQRAKD
jgi:hypothetical protein